VSALVEQPIVSSSRSWSARLDLEYTLRGQETVLVRSSHEGPLRVQRPFRETSGICQTYVLHPPGGIVGGDTLDVEVRAGAGARALLTTPGATKFYRSGGDMARQSQRLLVGPGGSVEWLPQETIVFDGANALSHTYVRLHPTSSCTLWDITCLGRPASKHPFTSGSFAQRLELYLDERPLLLEASRWSNNEALTAAWGLQGFPTYGTLVIHPLVPELLPVVREAVAQLWHPESEHRFAASQLPYSDRESTLMCRYVGTSAEHCKRLFSIVWRTVRPHLLGVTAEPPRVWNT
jgi:urease accessory protein